MSFDAVIGTSQKLMVSVEALAALAAKLRAHAEGLTLDAGVASVIDDVTTALGLDEKTMTAMSAEQQHAVIGLIRSFFRQAADLMDHPDRSPGWCFDDPTVLQSQGRGSMALAALITQLARGLGDLAERLQRPGAAFLDVGTGVGWLAVAMAEASPALQVTGIDIWPPALALARRNVAHLGSRVTLRELDVTALDDRDAFDAVFLPGPFLPRAIVHEAIARAHQALRPGGWLLFGLYAPTDEPLAALLTDLRIVRSGGHPWRSPDVVRLLEGAGFEHARAVERTWSAPMTFVVGACSR